LKGGYILAYSCSYCSSAPLLSPSSPPWFSPARRPPGINVWKKRRATSRISPATVAGLAGSSGGIGSFRATALAGSSALLPAARGRGSSGGGRAAGLCRPNHARSHPPCHLRKQTRDVRDVSSEKRQKGTKKRDPHRKSRMAPATRAICFVSEAFWPMSTTINPMRMSSPIYIPQRRGHEQRA
jgi:hypothetical protein